MNKFIILFLLICSVALAQEIGVRIIDTADVKNISAENIEIIKKYINREPIDAQHLVIMKPGIAEDKLLTDETERILVKGYLIGKAHIEAIPAKNDYVDEFNRGTVYFNNEKGNPFNPESLKMRNYSFHKVIIPDGTTIKGVNFTQKEPHTVAITGKNLTFIECNLKNVEIDVTWTLIDCLSIHARDREEKGFKIYEVEKNGKFEEVSREEIISDDIIAVK